MLFTKLESIVQKSSKIVCMDYKRRRGHVRPQETSLEYKKFVLIIVAIILASSGITWLRGIEINRYVSDFMAVFFITFASFKFANIDLFVRHFQLYDIIAKRFKLWGYVFPFVEATLGFAHLLSSGSLPLTIITMLFTGIGAAGVWMELKNRSDVMCACLGDIIRLPLSKVSFIENTLMFFMALFLQLV
jgi:hypothetical protein